MRHWTGVCLAAGLAFSMSACALTNEGVSDLRRMQPPAADSSSWGDWVMHKAPSNADDVIGLDDTVSITMDHIHVYGLIEPPISPQQAFLSGGWTAKSGEVALLAKAVVIDRSNKVVPSWTDLDGHRVIFYSGDVEVDQPLNGRNLPVFGPSKVPSGRLQLDFAMIEMDRTSAQVETLLKELADQGATALNLSNPAVVPLVKLGTSLLAADHDDTQLRYQVYFDIGAKGLQTLPLVEGRYVLLRTEDRQKAFDWRTVCLGVDDGVLYKVKDEDIGGGKPCDVSSANRFRKETYLSFRVVKGLPESAAVNLAELKDLGAELNARTNVQATLVNDMIGRRVVNSYRDNNIATVRLAWKSVVAAAADYAELAYVEPAVGTTCVAATGAGAGAAKLSLVSTTLDYYQQLAPLAAYVNTAPVGSAADTRNIKDAYTADAYKLQADVFMSYLLESTNWPGAKIATARDVAKFGTADPFTAGPALAALLVTDAETKGQARCDARLKAKAAAVAAP